MKDTVRKQKSGDQLAVGDWLAPKQESKGAVEVLFAHAYPASADGSRDNDGEHVHLVLREQGGQAPWATTVGGRMLFDLASDEDLAELREAAERATFAAGLREFAAWVEANPWAPVKRPGGYPQNARLQVDLHGADMGATDAAAVARVREIADRLGVKVQELDDRTDASVTIGAVSYSVIAWHRDGRPAEPAPEPIDCSAACKDPNRPDRGVHFLGCPNHAVPMAVAQPGDDPTGLAYSRADEADDPTPVSPARVPLHTGAVTDGGLVEVAAGQIAVASDAEPGCYHPRSCPRCQQAGKACGEHNHPGCLD